MRRRARAHHWTLAGLAAAIGAAAAYAACGGGGDDGSSGSPPAVGTPGSTPMRAEFGLDRRAPNPTCLAFPRPAAASGVTFERVFPGVRVEGLMALAQAPGDGSRWFAAERGGRIVSFAAAGPSPDVTLAADLVALSGKPVATDSEGGLLGMAFHPAFPDDGRLFVSFTTKGPKGYASEVGYLTSHDQGATFSSYVTVFRFDRANLYHCGGAIAFGRDGYLTMGFGDGANDKNGQDPYGPFAKIHRIDVDAVPAGGTFGIPTDNPFRAGGGEPSAFARGFRNPFRFSIDRATGDLWVGDVGQDSWEEIDRVELGQNHGWGCKEGPEPYPSKTPAKCPAETDLVDPVFAHRHVPPNSRSITGGIVYRGAAMPSFQGTYVYGDFMQLEAWALTIDDATGEAASVVLNEDGPRAAFTHFAEDVDGEIYASSVLDGSIYKLVPTGPRPTATVPERLSRTGCFDPADPTRPLEGLIPYGVNVELWSDGAGKERWFALPDGATIGVGDDGDLELPIGSVAIKTFSVEGRRVETRLLVRHDDGEWAGYTYEWDEAQTDATLLNAGKTRELAGRRWTFPSRVECERCHTAAAGRTLGLELRQLDGDFAYASTQRVANQLRTLERIGVFSSPLEDAEGVDALPAATSDATLEARARAYLHANCSMCHRPSGGAGRASMDLRFGTPLAMTRTCGVPSGFDDLGVAGAKLLDPGRPESSLLALRVRATDAKRMPPLATRVVDVDGAALLEAWIRSTPACP